MAGVAFTVYGIHWFAMARRYLGGKNLRRGLAVVNNLLEAWGRTFLLKKSFKPFCAFKSYQAGCKGQLFASDSIHISTALCFRTAGRVDFLQERGVHGFT